MSKEADRRRAGFERGPVAGHGDGQGDRPGAELPVAELELLRSFYRGNAPGDSRSYVSAALKVAGLAAGQAVPSDDAGRAAQTVADRRHRGPRHDPGRVKFLDGVLGDGPPGTEATSTPQGINWDTLLAIALELLRRYLGK